MTRFARRRWPEPPDDPHTRQIAEEVPVAVVHNGSTTAVMMATPADLEDFAVGFSVTEGAIAGLDEIRSLEVLTVDKGVEARLWLAQEAADRLAERRRRMAGPTGCGLCGLESLEIAAQPPPPVRHDLKVTADILLNAMQAMTAAQTLGAATRAVHAAGFWRDGALAAVREDAGRHNALDKLAGALIRRGTTADGVVLLTSRVSVEMVQKTARLGAPILCAVSAPTALAIRQAEAANLTLVAVCRSDGFEVFTHPHRVAMD